MKTNCIQRSHASKDEGFILVAILWIIAILTILTLGFAHRALIDQRASALSLDHSKAQYLARGSVRYAVADMRNKVFVAEYIQQLRQRAAGNNPQLPMSQMSSPLQSKETAPNLLAEGMPFTPSESADNKATYSIRDAEGLISLNTAPEELLDEIEGLGFTTVNAIMRHRGAELTPEERELFLAVEEIRYLEGVDEAAWEGDDDKPGLRDLFTVYGSGRININSAPRDVLLAIPDLDEGVVDQILNYRVGEDGNLNTADDRGFRSIETLSQQVGIDPTALAPIARFCTFQSQYFTITGFATQRQGKVRAAAQAVVHVHEGKSDVLAWSEGEFGP